MAFLKEHRSPFAKKEGKKLGLASNEMPLGMLGHPLLPVLTVRILCKQPWWVHIPAWASQQGFHTHTHTCQCHDSRMPVRRWHCRVRKTAAPQYKPVGKQSVLPNVQGCATPDDEEMEEAAEVEAGNDEDDTTL